MTEKTKKGSLSKDKKAGSATQSCPLEEKSLECDYDGLKLSFKEPAESASCNESRSKRDMSELVTKYASKDDNKFKKIHEYDTILEVLALPLTAGQTKKFHFQADAIVGQGPCEQHKGMDIRVKNMDKDDTLTENKLNVAPGKNYLVYGKHTIGDTHLAKTKGIVSFFWMFIDTSSAQYIKEADFTLKSCGSRVDGEKPNSTIKGLIRVYRDDRFTLSFNWKSKYQNGVGFKRSSDGKTETYTERSGSKLTSSYEGGELKGLKEENHGMFKNSSYSLDENGDEEVSKGSTKYNAKTFTIKRNGQELDVAQTVNKVLNIKDMVQDSVDFVKEIKDAIPQVGISGDVSVDFLFGTIEASWGLAKSNDSTKEYVWVEPDFKGSVKVTLIQIEASIKAGIQTASPAFLNWWGEKLWEFELSFSLGVSGSISLAGAINVVSGSIQSSSLLEEKAVIPGCEYKGNNGKEKQVILTEGEIKPICQGVAKVTIAGVGAEARMTLNGSIKVSAAIVWPFDIRYKGVLEEGQIVFTYEATNKRPSRPDPVKVWDKNDNLIKENYAFGGRL
jgi:hypothetical protein